jgi:regulator of replication initiation timing
MSTDKLQQLTERVERVCQVVDDLKRENDALTDENAGLKNELAEIRKLYEQFKLKGADQSEAVRGKLAGVLSRLQQLESMS